MDINNNFDGPGYALLFPDRFIADRGVTKEEILNCRKPTHFWDYDIGKLVNFETGEVQEAGKFVPERRITVGHLWWKRDITVDGTVSGLPGILERTHSIHYGTLEEVQTAMSEFGFGTIPDYR